MFSPQVFPCFAQSLYKSAGIVLTTGFFGCIIFMWVLDVCDWYDPSSQSSGFCVPGPIVYYYCLFTVGVV